MSEQTPPRTPASGAGTPPPTGSSSPPPGSSLGAPQREPQEIARALLDDVQLLFQKHIELAKQEVQEAAEARAVAAVAGVTAAVAGLFALGFLAAGAAYALEVVVAAWLARIIVGVAFLVVAGVAALIGRSRMTSPPMTPERTKQTLEEDAGWVRARMRR